MTVCEQPMMTSQGATPKAAALGPAEEEERVPMLVEACLKPEAVESLAVVRQAVLEYLRGLSSARYAEGALALPPRGEHPAIDANVLALQLTDLDASRAAANSTLLQWETRWDVCAFQLDTTEHGIADDDSDEDGESPSYSEWTLPSADFHGIWESLVYDGDLKLRLLRYAASALQFAERGVDPRLVSWNRVVLLHGPPGTGKTSLCKGLAQKLAIRLGDRYARGQLFEINAHSLFSKWFSESGKLVARLFSRIREAVAEEDALVFVLIDEVESLTAARRAAVAGSEPADAIRAVNALLTQLDSLRHAPNVMVLTTSNITEAIDLAFVDRADIKAYVGPPSAAARYAMLRSSLEELAAAGIITGAGRLPPHDLAAAAPAEGEEEAADGCSMQLEGAEAEAAAAGAADLRLGRRLLEVALAADGFSGRTLRKLPFLAHAGAGFARGTASMARFLDALEAAVAQEHADRAALVQRE